MRAQSLLAPKNYSVRLLREHATRSGHTGFSKSNRAALVTLFGGEDVVLGHSNSMANYARINDRRAKFWQNIAKQREKYQLAKNVI